MCALVLLHLHAVFLTCQLVWCWQLLIRALADHGEQLQSLGAGRWMRSILLAWDERHALLVVLLAAFGRAISEVGAVMVVGGNIEGFTRVMTTAIALETSKGDLPLALALGFALLMVVLLLNALVAILQRWGQGAGMRVGSSGAVVL